MFSFQFFYFLHLFVVLILSSESLPDTSLFDKMFFILRTRFIFKHYFCLEPYQKWDKAVSTKEKSWYLLAICLREWSNVHPHNQSNELHWTFFLQFAILRWRNKLLNMTSSLLILSCTKTIHNNIRRKALRLPKCAHLNLKCFSTN
jgi:hypothetical protein